jgi:hypothetical protein
VERQPVNRYLEILEILRSAKDTGLGVNEIHLQLVATTKVNNKPYIIEYIKELERANIIKTKESTHRQKEIKVLSDLGHELADLRHGITSFMSSYLELKQNIKQRYVMRTTNLDEKAKMSILLKRGWSRRDANWYDHLDKEAKDFEQSSATAFINALIVKYIQIPSRFHINDISRMILVKIITAPLENQILTADLFKTSDAEQITFSEVLSIPISKFFIKYLRYYRPAALGDIRHIFETRDKLLKEKIEGLATSLLRIMLPAEQREGCFTLDGSEGITNFNAQLHINAQLDPMNDNDDIISKILQEELPEHTYRLVEIIFKELEHQKIIHVPLSLSVDHGEGKVIQVPIAQLKLSSNFVEIIPSENLHIDVNNNYLFQKFLKEVMSEWVSEDKMNLERTNDSNTLNCIIEETSDYKLRRIKIDNYKKKNRIEIIISYFRLIPLANKYPNGRTPWLQRIRVP